MNDGADKRVALIREAVESMDRESLALAITFAGERLLRLLFSETEAVAALDRARSAQAKNPNPPADLV